MASEKAAWAMPRACAAMLGRDLLSDERSIRIPAPGSHTRFRFGTRQPSNVNATVFDPRTPSLSSGGPALRPGLPFSITGTEIAPLVSAIAAHLPNTK